MILLAKKDKHVNAYDHDDGGSPKVLAVLIIARRRWRTTNIFDYKAACPLHEAPRPRRPCQGIKPVGRGTQALL